MVAPRKIGVVGAGTMGSGIAQKVAQSGFPTVLMDIEQKYVDAGLARIRKMLEQGVARKVFKEGEPERILGLIHGTTNISDLADCDLVVEAVFEDFAIKSKLFKELEKVLRDDAVIGTNTSSYKVEALAEGTEHPERFVGLHYFFHPAKNRLLEVIPSAHTAKEALASAWAFAESTGKTGIHSKDVAGFVVNRFFVPWLNENVRMLEEGLADIPTIEETNKKLLGIGMGPFEVMNVTGVPIAQHAAEGLADAYGSFYAPAELLIKQVASGKDWDLSGDPKEEGASEVANRVLGLVVLVAATLVEEGVSTYEDADIGAKVGLRWRLGPFALANQKGPMEVAKASAAIAEKYSLPLPQSLKERLEAAKPFDLQAVSLVVEDGIGHITMNRPDALNALDPETVDSLARAFDKAALDDEVKAIVIDGRGKAFVAGADIKYFIRAIDEGDIERIVSFTRVGQELFLRIDNCPKPVVARLNGMALGGGAELALACDAIVADEGAVLGFPETGIGIYPGLGGTQRLVHRAGIGVARYLLFTGDILPAAKAAALGIVDKVASSGTSMGVVKELLQENLVPAGAGSGSLASSTDAKQPYEALFTDGNTEAILNGTFEPSEALAEKIAKKISFKAPIALKISDELMRKALEVPIEEGVELELGSLTTIFSTKDARVGLGSVGKGRPTFKGE